jgi:hypothetical protein
MKTPAAGTSRRQAQVPGARRPTAQNTYFCQTNFPFWQFYALAGTRKDSFVEQTPRQLR